MEEKERKQAIKKGKTDKKYFIDSQAAKRAYELLMIGLSIVFIALVIICVVVSQWIGGIALWIFLLIPAIWVVKSIKIIPAGKMAVKIILGVETDYCDSGFQFVPFFWGCYLKIYPKKKYNLDYRARVVVSKEGEYGQGKEKKRYGVQVLKVDAVAYINFPQNYRLIQILRSHIPIDDKELKGWTEEAVVGSLRVGLGQRTWKESTEDILNVKKKANEYFKSPEGPLISAGFQKGRIELAVEEIFLPKALEQALILVDERRLKKEAAPYEADQKAEETVGMVLQEFCKETGLTRKAIEKKLREAPNRFIRKYQKIWEKNWDMVLRKMAIDGKSFIHIKVDGAGDGNEGLGELLVKALSPLMAVWQKMPKGGSAREVEDSGRGKEIDREIEAENIKLREKS